MEERRHNEGRELNPVVAPPPMAISSGGTGGPEKPKRDDAVLRKIGAGLSVLGVGFMSYLATLHFQGADSSVCDLSLSLSCSAVNTSAYATLLGVPLSLMGIAYFATMIWAFLAKDLRHRYRIILSFTAFSVVFGLYLTGIERFAIGAFCLFCEGSKLLMLLVAVVAWVGAKRTGQEVASRMLVMAAIAGIVFSGLAYAVQREPSVTLDYTKEAQCLTEKGLVMYGAFGCSHCKRQKELFGDAFERIAYVECDARAGDVAEPERCFERGIRATPTWIQETADGEVLEFMEGVYDVSELVERFGCQQEES